VLTPAAPGQTKPFGQRARPRAFSHRTSVP
jgi:hypothetical protein